MPNSLFAERRRGEWLTSTPLSQRQLFGLDTLIAINYLEMFSEAEIHLLYQNGFSSMRFFSSAHGFNLPALPTC